MFTLNNRFFRHQACYSLLPAKPGGQADRVVSLCKYKVVALLYPPPSYPRLKKIPSTSEVKPKSAIERQVPETRRPILFHNTLLRYIVVSYFIVHDDVLSYGMENKLFYFYLFYFM